MRPLIPARWGVARPAAWSARPRRWAQERGLADRSPAPLAGDYRRARAIAAACGHWLAGEPPPQGGRGPHRPPRAPTPPVGGRPGAAPRATA